MVSDVYDWQVGGSIKLQKGYIMTVSSKVGQFTSFET